MLFTDLRSIGGEGADGALRSVTGYDLAAWNERWKWSLTESLEEFTKRRVSEASRVEHRPRDLREIARRVRLSDLLLERGHVRQASSEVDPAAAESPRDSTVRFRAARAKLALDDRSGATELLGTETEFSSVHGPWFALRGRLLHEAGDPAAAEKAFKLGISMDPLSEEVACEGYLQIPVLGNDTPKVDPMPSDPARRALCASARAAPQD